ncbi:MAG: hypothetical protein CM15mP3_05730 [Candidatus Poseidoniales archaeon]|nr:MAG: hypothetical protein CM15mP3_05730 [Candidatus Poseidoniales archaeon]
MFASEKNSCCAGPPELMSGANEVRINRTIADEIRRPPASSSLRFIVFTLPAGNRTVKRFWVVVSKIQYLDKTKTHVDGHYFWKNLSQS